MKRIILILFTLLFYLSLSAQSLADSLRKIGKLGEAIEQYAVQFNELPDDKVNTYKYACALALAEKVDSAFHYLNLAIKEDTSARPLNDPDFYYLLNDPRWDTLENEMLKRIEVKMFTYEFPDLTKELWRMKVRDQAFYYHESLSKNPLFSSAIWELKRKINEQNLVRLEEIITEYGWPKKSIVGGLAAGTAFLVVQHADLNTQKKYLPLMTEAANNGEADWSSLALLIDRINMREGKPQIYGSQIKINADGSHSVHEIIDPEYVNQRRAEVGLGSIQDYVGMWGIEWTIEQKTK